MKAKVYILACIEKNVVKVGVTRNDIKFRINNLHRECRELNFSCFYEKPFESNTAYKIEKEMLKVLKTMGSPIDYKFDGSGECVAVDCVSHVVDVLINHLEGFIDEPAIAPLDNTVGDLTIPAWLLQVKCVKHKDKDNEPIVLTLSDKLIYAALVQAKDIQQKEIADSLRVSVSVVEKCVRRLAENGLISVNRVKVLGFITSNSYSAASDFVITE